MREYVRDWSTANGINFSTMGSKSLSILQKIRIICVIENIQYKDFLNGLIDNFLLEESDNEGTN